MVEAQGVGVVHFHHIFYSLSSTHFNYETLYGNFFPFSYPFEVLFYRAKEMALPKSEVQETKLTAYV